MKARIKQPTSSASDETSCSDSSDTPETDAISNSWAGNVMAPWNLARKLERERDELKTEIQSMMWDVSRVEWKYGRNDDGSPKQWKEWDAIRDHLRIHGALRQPQELSQPNETSAATGSERNDHE